MKIYFAQIMDNLAYFEHEKKIADMLENMGHTVYFPWRDEGVHRVHREVPQGARGPHQCRT